MFHFPKKKNAKKNKKVDEKVKELNTKNQGMELSTDLQKNIELFKNLFKDDDTFITRRFKNRFDELAEYCIVYDQSVSKTESINEAIIKPLMLAHIEKSERDQLDTLQDQVLMVNQVEKTAEMSKIIESVTYGDTILLVDGEAEALILNSKSFQTRSIEEPMGEQTLTGPREGFAEVLMLNLSLIRRRVRTNDLKMKFYSIGERTKTKACICYMDSLVNKNILKELFRRLDTIKIDCVLDTNYITELIKDNKWSPFRTTGYTEKPDVVVGKLMEGRIAILLDGTPMVMTIPYLFIENFQSGEDYYYSFFYTSIERILRIVSYLLTISVPAFYIAIVAYHQEIIPTQLLLSIAVERSSVPLPAWLEAYVMLIVFDILKETGIRMPSNVGQALSIVGALVIGQAAVEAKLVASPMIIVVAITAITGLMVPKMNANDVWVRYILLALGASFGLFGYIIGMSALLVHLLNLRSFGIPMLTPIDKMQYEEANDIFYRAPWWEMKWRHPKAMVSDGKRLDTQNGSDNH